MSDTVPMPRLLMIDNYDSFTYNVVQLIMSITSVDMVVKRNDECTIDNLLSLAPDGIVISPGPKAPQDAGLSKQIIKEFGPHVPILSICLGMQCLNEVFGGETREAKIPVHGKTSLISHNGKGLFGGVSSPLRVARYHSLVIDRIPSSLEVDAVTVSDSIPMAIHHKAYRAFGVQFHPESFLTDEGDKIIRNFLKCL